MHCVVGPESGVNDQQGQADEREGQSHEYHDPVAARHPRGLLGLVLTAVIFVVNVVHDDLQVRVGLLVDVVTKTLQF